MMDGKEVLRRTKGLQAELQTLPGVARRSPSARGHAVTLEVVVADADLYKVVGKLFNDGHHARAVEEAFKFLNNVVKRRAGLGPEKDGADLMRQVFSAKNPVLRLNAGVFESQQKEQHGYMDIMAGVMTGIRNPRAHEHDWEDTEERALQLLSLANHLVARVKASTKA